MDFSKLKENKMLLYLGGLVVLFVIFILVIGACSLTTGVRTTYSGLEDIMISAAKNYYQDNSKLLPTVGNDIGISSTMLTSEGYMKDISSLSPKNSSCTGNVVVRNTNGNFKYSAFLDCGDDYKSYSLSQYIKNNSQIVQFGDGLYEHAGDLVYRGEEPNNYIKFANRMYRIVSVNSNDTITIIDNERSETDVWDDRYNADRTSNDGLNTYSLSRLRDRLINFVNSNSFSDSDRVMLENTNVCVGKVSTTTPVSRNMECYEVMENQVIYTLSLSQFMYASLDANCVLPEDGSCQNYNYLSKHDYSWWTVTGDLDNTYKVYSVGSESSAHSSRCSSNGFFRDVVTLAKNTTYVSGTGTASDPFIVK